MNYLLIKLLNLQITNSHKTNRLRLIKEND